VMRGIDPKILPEIPCSQMKVISVDKEKQNGADGRARNAIDGNNMTIWQTKSYPS
jgi:hypothetical protein